MSAAARLVVFTFMGALSFMAGAASSPSASAIDTPLLRAVRDGRLDEAKALLDAKADWLATDVEGNTALHLAAAHGPEMCALFVDRGMPVDARNHSGFSPLHAAVIAGHEASVAYFLDKGANVNAETLAPHRAWNLPARATPLDLARAGEAQRPHDAANYQAIAELLSSRGGKANRQPFRPGRLLWLPVLPVFFLLFFWGLFHLDARITGWSAMADRFTATSTPAGVSTQDGTVGEWGLVHTKGLMRVHAGDDGLYIAYPGWLSAGHPPLLIPWSEIRLKDSSDVLGTRVVRLSVGEPELAVVIIRGGAAEAIEERLTLPER